MKQLVHVWQSHYPWEVRVGKINRALASRGIQTTVVARRRSGEPAEEVLEDAHVTRVGWPKARALSSPLPFSPLWLRTIVQAVKQSKAEMVLVRDIPLALVAARAARQSRIPVVLDMAEHYPEAMRSWKKYSVNPILRKLVHDWRLPDALEARVVRQMDGILVVCEEQRERLVSQYGFPADRICVVLNTPERGQFDAYRSPTPHERPFRFGYHGILCDDRDLESVIRGFDLAAVQAPDITLLIAGGGESESALRELAATLSSNARIRFTGRYRPEEQADLYAEVDFGVVSLRANVFTEHTIGNKFFDYAAMGKPFIYTDLKPLRHVMSRMNCGMGFAPGNPQAIADAFLKIRQMDYKAMSKSGIAAIDQEFNWETDKNRLLEFLDSVSQRTKRA